MAAMTVIGSSYCNASATDIGVLTPVLPPGGNKILVTDTNHSIIFRVEDTSNTFHKQRALVDPAGTPVVTFRAKTMSMHKRWTAFRGGSTEKRDLIFTAKQPALVGNSDVYLNVFLANNEDEKLCDYRVDSSFVFYAGYSGNKIIAKAKEQLVKVCPNVDMAFIASLIVVLDGIHEQEEKNSKRRRGFLVAGAKATSEIVGNV